MSIVSLLVLLLISFVAAQFDVKPPEEVTAYPGQNVTLPCVIENDYTYQTVSWVYTYKNNRPAIITQNRDLDVQIIDNFQFSILGEDNNFTLHIVIPERNKIDFGDDDTITKSFQCSVYTVVSKVTIRKFFNNPICLFDETIYSLGQTLTFACVGDSDSNIITNLKSQKGQIISSNRIYTSYVTKEDNNAIYICESQKIGTNQIRSCSAGPITVNYKPEINIKQISPLEFYCTAEARPPVNETVWIVEASVPKNHFTNSNGTLKFTEPTKFGSEIKCEAENILGKESKSLIISLFNKKEEEIIKPECDSGIVYFILSSVVGTVFIVVAIVLCYCKYKRNQATDYDDTIVAERRGRQVPEQHVRQEYQTLQTINKLDSAYETIPPINIGVNPDTSAYITTIDGELAWQQETVCDEPYIEIKEV